MSDEDYLNDLKPMQNTTTAEWNVSVTHNDYQKMLKGFEPQDMDDKWGTQYDTPDAQGNIVLHLYRSWGAQPIYSLTITPGDPNETQAKDWATIVKISWDKQPGDFEIPEDEAKNDAIELCNGLLRCELKD